MYIVEECSVSIATACISADVMVWSCDHVTQWVDSIGLGEYSAHLKEGGVHSGVIVLDREFDYEKLCLVLQIPLTSPEVGVPWFQWLLVSHLL